MRANVIITRKQARSIAKDARLETLMTKLKYEPGYELTNYMSDCVAFVADFRKKKRDTASSD